MCDRERARSLNHNNFSLSIFITLFFLPPDKILNKLTVIRFRLEGIYYSLTKDLRSNKAILVTAVYEDYRA